jgi:CoA-transferase family III
VTRPFFDVFDLPYDVKMRVIGSGGLPSVYDVTGFVTAAMAAVVVATQKLVGALGHTVNPGTVDRRRASLWMGTSIAPVGWELPSAWDDIAGDYQAADGWIRLHTNAAKHREAALRILGCEPTKEAVVAAVARWSCDDLESRVHEEGGVAAHMRTVDEWELHPQGRAVRSEPLVRSTVTDQAPVLPRTATAQRPLNGVRVLDLTKVLAGPVATRVLASLGADVIRFDSFEWTEPGVSQDMTVGKRCAHIDGRTAAGRDHLRELFSTCDIFVHGYRPGALDALGLGTDDRRELNPGVVDVSLNAFGHTGPWRNRRGFDSIVQMSCGIAAIGMQRLGRDRPTPLPVQALDHVTGYLMASTAVNAWATRLSTGCGSTHFTSLARTAAALMDGPSGDPTSTVEPVADDDYSEVIEPTSWGPARRLIPPYAIDGVDIGWTLPATALGSSPLPMRWRDA